MRLMMLSVLAAVASSTTAFAALTPVTGAVQTDAWTDFSSIPAFHSGDPALTFTFGSTSGGDANLIKSDLTEGGSSGNLYYAHEGAQFSVADATPAANITQIVFQGDVSNFSGNITPTLTLGNGTPLAPTSITHVTTADITAPPPIGLSVPGDYVTAIWTFQTPVSPGSLSVDFHISNFNVVQDLQLDQVAVVPEPAAATLLLPSLALLRRIRRR